MVIPMRENIATIPLIDAFKADDECPFCNLERKAEQHAVSFILGSAYMEDDIRADRLLLAGVDGVAVRAGGLPAVGLLLAVLL